MEVVCNSFEYVIWESLIHKAKQNATLQKIKKVCRDSVLYNFFIISYQLFLSLKQDKIQATWKVIEYLVANFGLPKATEHFWQWQWHSHKYGRQRCSISASISCREWSHIPLHSGAIFWKSSTHYSRYRYLSPFKPFNGLDWKYGERLISECRKQVGMSLRE